MIQLRDYQENAVNKIKAALKKSPRKKIICEMPTGGGKTVIFSYIIHNAEAKGTRTIILTDRDELLKGTGGTLNDFGINVNYVKAGANTPPKHGNTFVCMVQTLRNRISDEKWMHWINSCNFFIIDECHKGDFDVFFEQNIFSKHTVIGFSATPMRTGKQIQLSNCYDEIVHTLTTKQLIKKGFLCAEMYYGVEAPNLQGVKKNSKGDFDENEMYKRYDKPNVYGGLVENLKTHAGFNCLIASCDFGVLSTLCGSSIMTKGFVA